MEKIKGANITIWAEIGKLKLGQPLYTVKALALSLPKIGRFKIGLILEKSKGVNLTFWPKIGRFKIGLFLEKKPKGFAFLFGHTSGDPRKDYF